MLTIRLKYTVSNQNLQGKENVLSAVEMYHDFGFWLLGCTHTLRSCSEKFGNVTHFVILSIRPQQASTYFVANGDHIYVDALLGESIHNTFSVVLYFGSEFGER